MEGEVFDERLGEPQGDDWENEFTQPEPEAPKDFPDHLFDPFQQLVQLGHLEDQWEMGGQEFKIRTIRVGEELTYLRLTKPYQGQPAAEGRAYAAAMVAASMVSLNGQPLAVALSPTQDVSDLKFKKVLRWHWPVIEHVFQHYLSLEKKQREVLLELQKVLDDEPTSDQDDDPPVE